MGLEIVLLGEGHLDNFDHSNNEIPSLTNTQTVGLSHKMATKSKAAYFICLTLFAMTITGAFGAAIVGNVSAKTMEEDITSRSIPEISRVC